MVDSIKKYFQRVGRLPAGTDIETFDLNNPQSLFNFETALGAPSLSNYFKVSMQIASENASPTSQFPADGTSNLNELNQNSQNRKVAASLNQWLTSAGLSLIHI